MKISILLLSWDRRAELQRTLEHNLNGCGHPFELLVCDQGSNMDVLGLLGRQNPAYFRKNSRNEGIGRSFNQLYLRSTGSHIALMSNDILWPNGWGRVMVDWLEKVPNAGLVGFEWWDWLMPPVTKKFGFHAHWLVADKNRVYGPVMFKRRLVETLGLFPEHYGPYGEDFNFNERINRAGFNSFYIPQMKAEHIGHDVGQDSEYRRMKDKSAGDNLALFWQQHALWEAGETLREELPPMRDPL